MTKKIKLSESNLNLLIKKILKEMMDVSSDSEYYKRRKREIKIPFDEVSRLYHLASRFCESKMGLLDCQEIEDVAREFNLKFG
jgi:hypothetical protein